VGKYGLFDSAGHLVALPGEVGDVVRTEEVACGSGMLAYDGGKLIGEGQLGLVVVFPHPDVHGSLRFSYIGGCTWIVGVSGTWRVVNHGGLVDVGDGVFEVDELGAEGVLVVGCCDHVGLAEGSADDLRCAAVVWEGDSGFVFGGGCGGRRHTWGLVGWLGSRGGGWGNGGQRRGGGSGDSCSA
jgi:hypothetical protein